MAYGSGAVHRIPVEPVGWTHRKLVGGAAQDLRGPFIPRQRGVLKGVRRLADCCEGDREAGVALVAPSSDKRALLTLSWISDGSRQSQCIAGNLQWLSFSE